MLAELVCRDLAHVSLLLLLSALLLAPAVMVHHVVGPGAHGAAVLLPRRSRLPLPIGTDAAAVVGRSRCS